MKLYALAVPSVLNERHPEPISPANSAIDAFDLIIGQFVPVDVRRLCVFVELGSFVGLFVVVRHFVLLFSVGGHCSWRDCWLATEPCFASYSRG